MSDEVLRLRGVVVRHERSMLLRDVDWTVRSDESWVVIGPNGAGKTTLLQVAGAMLLPTEGTAEILGEPVGEADLQDLRSRIGIASASPGPTGSSHDRKRRGSRTNGPGLVL